MRAGWMLLLLGSLCLISVSARAKELVVGQTAAFSRDTQKVSLSVKAGIELALEAANRSGGIHGQTVRLVTRDRGLASDDAVRVTRELVRDEKPLALVGLMGTGPMEEMLRQGAVTEAGVPIVGMRTGAYSIREPLNPWLFHTRAGYADEASKIVQYLWTVGYRRFAVLYENTAFGKEGLSHVTQALAARSLGAPCAGSYEQNSTEVKAALDKIGACRPDAVVAVGASNSVADFYKAVHAARWGTPVIAMSTVDAAAVVRRIGKEEARGLGIARVVPDPDNRRSVLAREFQDTAQRLRGKGFDSNQASLEGYVAAKVLLEGLKRAGPDPTPAKLKTALESLRDFDMGGLVIGFSKDNHAGTRHVDVGILNRDGRMLQ